MTNTEQFPDRATVDHRGQTIVARTTKGRTNFHWRHAVDHDLDRLKAWIDTCMGWEASREETS